MNAPAPGGIALSDALERNRQDERRRALRALLLRPLLTADHPAFVFVRRHAPGLREWLNRETGWVLQLEGDFARLHKRVANTDDPTRPARPEHKPGTPALSRRRYALLCLALADLERGENQITLGQLGELMMAAATDPVLQAAGLRFTLESREERRDLVAVVRLLLSLGLLCRVAGDEEAYINQGADALYDVNRRLLSALLVTTRGPSMAEMDDRERASVEERIAAITETFTPDTREARNRLLRHRLTRRLLDDPVVYWDELSEDELAYLTTQRAAIIRRIEEATGLVAEVRAEGMAMVDPAGEFTDERMPSEGTEGHATLLLAEYLANTRRGMEAHAPAEVPLETLHRQMRSWTETYRRYWRKAVREPGAEVALCDQAVERLGALRLVERTSEGVRALPALGRYALDSPELPQDAQWLEPVR